jgi:hypothetical protein
MPCYLVYIYDIRLSVFLYELRTVLANDAFCVGNKLQLNYNMYSG